MSVERVLILKISNWRKLYYNKTKAFLTSIAVTFLVFCINCPILTVDKLDNSNLTNVTYEYFKIDLVDTYIKVKFNSC